MRGRLEAPCGGIPIRYAQIEWTPVKYAGWAKYAETVGRAVVIDRREIHRLAEEGRKHPLVDRYPCSDGACWSHWEKRPTKYLIMSVMRLCMELMLFDVGIEKRDVFGILNSISETRYIFNDDVFRLFGRPCPSEDESEAYERYLGRLYGVRS